MASQPCPTHVPTMCRVRPVPRVQEPRSGQRPGLPSLPLEAVQLLVSPVSSPLNPEVGPSPAKHDGYLCPHPGAASGAGALRGFSTSLYSWSAPPALTQAWAGQPFQQVSTADLGSSSAQRAEEGLRAPDSQSSAQSLRPSLRFPSCL